MMRALLSACFVTFVLSAGIAQAGDWSLFSARTVGCDALEPTLWRLSDVLAARAFGAASERAAARHVATGAAAYSAALGDSTHSQQRRPVRARLSALPLTSRAVRPDFAAFRRELFSVALPSAVAI
jgi:hypothetical protein